MGWVGWPPWAQDLHLYDIIIIIWVLPGPWVPRFLDFLVPILGLFWAYFLARSKSIFHGIAWHDLAGSVLNLYSPDGGK